MGGQLDLALGRRGASALTVTQLVRMVREALEERFNECWVVGEISNARFANSNHFYFTLKDANAAINAVMFASAKRRLRFRPTDGMQVIVRGRVNVYETRGSLQLYAEEMEPRGAGALQVAFEQLKKRLADEGLFDAARKRALPFLPRTVGIVTALGGAGLRDILRVLFERFPNLHVIVRPARVQGSGAAEEIAQAIDDLNRDGRADVIIVGRGGGSLEDLWAFNEEVVARAIYRSACPIVSAVGHEIDYTIADFVADVRAPTPTFAAHLVAPDKSELSERIAGFARAMESAIRKALADLNEEVARLGSRVRHPRLLIRDARQRLDEAAFDLKLAIDRCTRDARLGASALARRLRAPLGAIREARLNVARLASLLAAAGRSVLESRQTRLGALASQLDSLSPLRVLERGYAVVTNQRDGRVVTDAQNVEIGDLLDIRLKRGRLRARAESRQM
jgi:exodeoxyribonuclease VII large subunit